MEECIKIEAPEEKYLGTERYASIRQYVPFTRKDGKIDTIRIGKIITNESRPYVYLSLERSVDEKWEQIGFCEVENDSVPYAMIDIELQHKGLGSFLIDRMLEIMQEDHNIKVTHIQNIASPEMLSIAEKRGLEDLYVSYR